MNFVVNLTGEEVDVVLEALNELPAKISMAVILSIREQCDKQAAEVTDKDKKEQRLV